MNHSVIEDREVFDFSFPRDARTYGTASQKVPTAYLEQNRRPGYQVAVGILCSLSHAVVLLRLLSRKVLNLRF